MKVRALTTLAVSAIICMFALVSCGPKTQDLSIKVRILPGWDKSAMDRGSQDGIDESTMRAIFEKHMTALCGPKAEDHFVLREVENTNDAYQQLRNTGIDARNEVFDTYGNPVLMQPGCTDMQVELLDITNSSGIKTVYQYDFTAK